jgi:hypothetical protein
MAPFAFVCYADPEDKEYGIKCAQAAVSDLDGKEIEGM